MRTSTVVMIAFAVVFGLLAVFVAQSWLNSQAEQRMRSLEANKKQTPVATVVVAAKPLRYGNTLAADHLRETPWPANALPAGAFAKIADVMSHGRRVALASIEPNEPVLAAKITGPGQRATLSALLRDGLKAVTIRVNDVDGVGGFVLPGDRVDVALTRQTDKTNATSDVVLQNARVLAIDQVADERTEKPTVVKAVTLEVDAIGAQKLSLSASVGSLSLMLRKAGEASSEFTRRLTLNDLGVTSTPTARERGNAGMVTVAVRRASTREEYSVPAEGAGLQAAVAGDR
ncbi:MAG: Flp pilus assembly protein CpaB [Alphaproteobacteria bacterium]|nr:Flp pilus assembly protein CpaB [Alphaproteobacteria bacterium]